MVCEERYYKSYMQFNQLNIRCYSPEEIKKLSVVELNQAKTFDEAGFPVKNGLYDAALGTLSLNEICKTCGLKGNNCPGHYGHMQLSVPTFNPLFFSFTFNLMKASCIHCHRFTCNSEKNTDENIDEIAVFLKKYACLPNEIVKNNIENKHSLLQIFLKEKLFKRRIKCPLCKRSNGILRNDANRAFILDFTTGLSSIREKNKKLEPKINSTNEIFEVENELNIAENYNKSLDKEKLEVKLSEVLDTNSVLNPLTFSEKFLNEQLNYVVSGKCNKLIWRAAEVREHFRILWNKERLILETLFAIFKMQNNLNFHPTDFLFCQTILVQPSKFRPQRFLRGESYEHPITANYRRVMEADQLLTVVKIVMSSSNNDITVEVKNLLNTKTNGKSLNEKLHNAYLDLQMRINCLYDQEADKYNLQQHPGLRQIIEKKEGIFRMNMMGKRVDYACRSVVTPDPYLDVDEIGIPELFARRLTFPEPTNFLNVSKLRKIIRKGPSEYPGANFVQVKGNFKQILPSSKEKIQERIAVAKRLTPGITKNNGTFMPSHVFRHLERGDHLLMNRQPSLHRPSIMGHKARILKDQKALRMNYAPCKAYNADFDGDEMNGHFLQNRIAQSEASELANVASNYLVPKDGTPILGLIQDHVVSGVLLTLRDRFLTKELYMHLILSAFAESTTRIIVPFPAMLKPQLLWTGKQVITAIVINSIPANKPKINLSSKAKTPLSCWKVRGVEIDLIFEMSESQVIFREGELLCGVLDKEHYGATQYGLIHSCYELYGPKIATKILSCFSRLFTTYLQHHGFTLGVADILVNKEADKFRRKKIRELRLIGPQVVEKTFNLTNPTSQQIEHILASAYNNPRKDKTDVKQLDFTMKQVLAKYNEQINQSCVPNGLIRCFPNNALQMMIQCGAKGSMISCALGQIELEGQRPPLSAVGRSLPSFKCFDPSPKAGGFVDQRFLTGLQPQELFFHTMAGREGLIDTAVKTSRSGYLQRCIIKHLEGIYVRYDQTVRDHDGSVVQFRYGEDGLDIGRATFITPKQFKFLSENAEAVLLSAMPTTARYCDWSVKKSEKYFKRLLKCKKKKKIAIEEKKEKIFSSSFLNFCKNQIKVKSKEQLCKEWYEIPKVNRKVFEPDFSKYIDSVDVKFNSLQTLGALPEKLLEQFLSYIKSNNISQNFHRILFWKGMRAFVEAGENVGLLAAQSIGEPSTQMTLNTFHFAGRGEMNVTLGIPRLREILMTSGKNILTPITEVVIRDGVSDKEVEKLKIDLNPIILKDVLKNFVLEEHIECGNGKLWRSYTLTIELLKTKNRKMSARFVKKNQILSELERRFFKEVAVGINKRFKDVLEHQQIQHRRLRNITKLLLKDENDNNADVEKENFKNSKKKTTEVSSDEDDDENTKDAEEIKLKKRHQDDGVDYEGEEEENNAQKKNSNDENLHEFYKMEDNDDYGTEEELSDEFNNNKINYNVEKDQQFVFKKNENLSKIVAEANKSNANNQRIQEVLKSHQIISDYIYDSKNDRWCTVPLKNETKLDIMAVITSIIQKFVVFQVNGIEKAIIREELRREKKVKILQVQGVNIEALYSRINILDVNTLYSNDINFMLNKYGIEACGQTIAKEMNNVFSVYGIEVNFRHLSLTADFITFTGEIKPFSRGAMASNASPLQKMSFETTANFLRDSIITGQPDNLCSPSARLVTGQLHRGGTGSFELLQNPAYFNLLTKRPKLEIKEAF